MDLIGDIFLTLSLALVVAAVLIPQIQRRLRRNR